MPNPSVFLRKLAAGGRALLPTVRKLSVATLLIAIPFSLYWFATTAAAFSIRRVEVHGNDKLSPDHILELLELEQSTNIFGVELRALEKKLQRDPWIGTADVRQRLPSTLLVEIQEHRPAAAVQLGPSLYLVGDSGGAFKRAEVKLDELDDLVVITGLKRTDYINHPHVTKAIIRRALVVINTYQRGTSRPEIGELNVNKRTGYSVITSDPVVTIRLGREPFVPLSRALSAFDTAWKALSKTQRRSARIIYADNPVRPDRVTVRFLQGRT